MNSFSTKETTELFTLSLTAAFLGVSSSNSPSDCSVSGSLFSCISYVSLYVACSKQKVDKRFEIMKDGKETEFCSERSV